MPDRKRRPAHVGSFLARGASATACDTLPEDRACISPSRHHFAGQIAPSHLRFSPYFGELRAREREEEEKDGNYRVPRPATGTAGARVRACEVLPLRSVRKALRCW